MEGQNPQATGGLWLNYGLLFLASFSAYLQPLSLLALAAFLFGYILRRRARKQGRDFNAAHASWQVNTLWLGFLLVIVFTVALISVVAFMGENAADELNAIADGPLSAQEKMLAFWNIPCSRMLIIGIFAFSFTLMIWPFQRILHGILALHARKCPLESGSGSLPALGLAIIIQLFIPLTTFLL